MSNFIQIAELFLSPKRNGFPVLLVLVGFGFAHLGYNLFMANVQDGGAALNIVFSESKKFEMGKGGPGLIFCAFGMGIIVYAIKSFSKLRVQNNPEVGIDEDGRTYELDENGEKVFKD